MATTFSLTANIVYHRIEMTNDFEKKFKESLSVFPCLLAILYIAVLSDSHSFIHSGNINYDSGCQFCFSFLYLNFIEVN